ncbi:membrane-associated proteins in eicosanoid and glutathione metabolism [Periconia macrospinosa]|uniref:Membrane-associated proteins in eicosanoid and glutathione metabolism n=1 Tax=Periconia macrospinosa TaxID=97972 RepID=A0A2V1E3B8_9PLEO|nr:membrane-associated proteins in eicosanoid and glutathione metabolism [Periconia macrospinosa]
MVALEVPAGYGYVLAAATSTFFVAAYLGGRVVTYRKAAKIPYPHMYATPEQISSAPPARAKLLDAFNRAQRGHQNFLESQASTIAAMCITGLVYPKMAAALGATWSVGRILYAWGYNNDKEEGKGRYNGAPGLLAHYVLCVSSVVAVWQLVRQGV